jgi:hypothetical protein
MTTQFAESIQAEGTVYFDRLIGGVYQGLQRFPGPVKLETKFTGKTIEVTTKEKGKYNQIIASGAYPEPAELALTLNGVSPASLAMALMGVDAAFSQGSGTVAVELTAKLGRNGEIGKKNIAANSVAVGLKSEEVTVTLTRSSNTATATKTTHGYTSGDKVVISGANEADYNGLHTITVTDADTFTFAVSGTPDTPATGTIKALKMKYVAGTDFSVNHAMGLVYFDPAGTIADAATVVIAASHNAVDARKIVPGTTALVKGRLLFDGKSLLDETPIPLEIYEVSLTSDKAIDWLSDKPIEISLKGRMVTPDGKDGPMEVLTNVTFS